MALTAAQQKKVGTAFADAMSRVNQATSVISKADLIAAIAAANTWQGTNQAAYNTALPDAFRNNATATQKTLLFMATAMADYLLADPDAITVLERLLGEMRDITEV